MQEKACLEDNQSFLVLHPSHFWRHKIRGEGVNPEIMGSKANEYGDYHILTRHGDPELEAISMQGFMRSKVTDFMEKNHNVVFVTIL